MDVKSHEKLMTNVLQELIDKVNQISPKVLEERFMNHPESKRGRLIMLIGRCKGHHKLMTSAEWEILSELEQAIIVRHAKKDMNTLEELTYE